MAILEEDVLEAKDSKIKDSDKWPSYTLKRTRVLSQATGEPVSLFTANTDHPVEVLGILDSVNPVYKKNIKNNNYRSKLIHLAHITTYAFAEYEDGTYGFWAAGKAGWFELKNPVPIYKPVFDTMHEAASMFYMLADKLRRAHKTNPKLSAKGLERYTNAIFRDVSIEKLVIYIGIICSAGTQYYLHGSNPLGRLDLDSVREGFHQHCEYIITCMLEGQEGLQWEKSSIFNYFKHKFPEIIAKVESRMGRSRVLDNSNTGYESQRRSSKPGRPSGSRNVGGRPSLRKAASRHASNAGADQVLTKIDKSSSSSSNASADDGPETPSQNSSPENGSHKRKSILQPKGSKYSKKAMARRGKFPVVNHSDSDDSSVEEVENGASPLATIATRDTATLPNRTAAKPAKHSSALDNYASHHTYLPHITEKKILVSYPLPSTIPQGPGDVWTCTFEGCHKRVHAASTEEGKAEMQEHFRDHTTSAEEKIQLAMTESRPYLPVNNLVAHLQAHYDNGPSEAAYGGAKPGVLFPKPIKRSRFFN